VIRLLLSKVNGPEFAPVLAGAMHGAAKKGQLMVLQLLFAHKVDVNHTTKGNTCLHIASNRGQLEVVRMLAENGADLSMNSIQGKTALVLASQHGQEKAAKDLLARKADVNTVDGEGKTALHWSSSDDLRQLLLGCAASLEARDVDGKTPLYHAVELAATAGETNLSPVDHLIRLGAKVETRASNRRTPLDVACRSLKPDLVRLLLEHKADPLLAADPATDGYVAAMIRQNTGKTAKTADPLPALSLARDVALRAPVQVAKTTSSSTGAAEDAGQVAARAGAEGAKSKIAVIRQTRSHYWFSVFAFLCVLVMSLVAKMWQGQ
jgi:hypothetical protein